MLKPDRKPFQRVGKNIRYGGGNLSDPLEALRGTEFDTEAYRKPNQAH